MDYGSLPSAEGGDLRVLMQIRPTAELEPASDSYVLERLSAELRRNGVQVTVDLKGTEDPALFNLVHLLNLNSADWLQAQAQRAHRARVPFVVTALCRDVPLFLNKSIAAADHLLEYVRRGQSVDWYREHQSGLGGISAAPADDSSWAVKHAAAIFAGSDCEADVIRRLYPESSRIETVPFACEINTGSDAGLFQREFGIGDFVLCVGRFEARKNQLALLKALEDLDLTLVLIGGGSKQPNYEQAVRAFRRKGRTLVLGRVSSDLLASAYRAARVHCLPSWYEVPGLTSLEAAASGCNVVVTANSGVSEYLGDAALYCDPSSVSSIRSAVVAAYYGPVHPELRQRALKQTWSAFAARIIGIYRSVSRQSRAQSSNELGEARQPLPARHKPVEHSLSLDEELNSLEVLRRSGDYGGALYLAGKLLQRSDLGLDLREQIQLLSAECKLLSGDGAGAALAYEQALRSTPRSAGAKCGLGALAANAARWDEAQTFFENALADKPEYDLALAGLGICCAWRGDLPKAMEFYQRALQANPECLAAVLGAIELGYGLKLNGSVERAIKGYLDLHPADLDCLYALAGCYYTQGRFNEALEEINKITLFTPSHGPALHLRRMIDALSENRNAIGR